MTDAFVTPQIRILRKLGAGGMGVVYLAEDIDLQRELVVKVMGSRLFGQDDKRNRFLREARTAAALSHPNICTIYQVGQVEGDTELSGDPNESSLPAGSLFIAMEYIPGRTLTEIIEESGPLALDRFLDLATQIVSGVGEAHSHSIVHRDLKPANIMVTEGDRVKILDFGLAKAFQAISDASTSMAETASVELTQEGVAIGTPGYMSPEQALGTHVDSRSDVFSLGLVLFEMLAGRRAFTGGTAVSVIAKIIGENAPPLFESRPDLPAGLDTILSRCLEKDPANRYPDAAAVHGALTELETAESEAAAGVRLPRAFWPVLLALLGIVVAGGLIVSLFGDSPVETRDELMLAVLPFANHGSPDQDYFALGITEEISSRIARLHGLAVISHTSTRQYKGSEDPIERIGRELDVDYVLDGSVRWDRPSEGPDRVLISPSLIRVDGEQTVWTDGFEREFQKVFRLQTDIAETVAQQLDLTLLEPTREAFRKDPTQNLEAYDAFLRGRHFASLDYSEESATKAVEMYEQATRLDSTFALAFGHLSMAHSWVYWAGYDVSDERRTAARTALDRAEHLAPELPETRLARGYYAYRVERDFDEALRSMDLARDELPNHSDLIHAMGAVRRRQGDFENGLDDFIRAARLDPRSHLKAWEVGETLRFLRRFEDAEIYYNRAIDLDPGFLEAYAGKAELVLLGRGSPASARTIIENLDIEIDDRLAWPLVASEIFERDIIGALEQLSRVRFGDPVPSLVFRLWIHHAAGNLQERRQAANGILAELDDEGPALDNPDVHSLRGLAYAALGRRDEALESGNRSLQLLPVSEDALEGTFLLYQMAWIHALLEDGDETMDTLEQLLSIPSLVTTYRIEMDPTFDPWRDTDRMKRILESPGR